MKRAIWALAIAGCVTEQASPTAGVINSLAVTLTDPTTLGSAANPIDVKQATFDVKALDENGQLMAIDTDVNIYISFGGVKTGAVGTCGVDTADNAPIDTVHLTAGAATGKIVALPQAFGETSVWVEERQSRANGASPTIYFRNPHILDVQKPADPLAKNATFCSTFNNRFVIIDQPTGAGQLVVTSVFSNAFSVTDTGATDFNNIFLFAFGKPPTYIVPGRVMKSFSGNYSKFVGFTELNFPLFIADMTAPLAPLPPPVMLSAVDLSNQPKLIGASAGTVQYTGVVCDPHPPNPNHDANIQKTIDTWNKYNEFVVDAGAMTCDSFTNFSVGLPGKTLGTFDPAQVIGQKLTVIGMLQNHSGQNPVVDAVTGQPVSCSASVPCPTSTNSCIQGECFKGAYNFWSILPRTPADIVSVTP